MAAERFLKFASTMVVSGMPLALWLPSSGVQDLVGRG